MKRIFVACPIGEDNSEPRKRSDSVLKHIILPAVGDVFGSAPHEVVRSDTLGQPGRISIQILKELREADVVIADLADLNPNVFYEFGVRQALLKPYVLLAPKNQKLPFDVADLRTIFYVLDLDGAERVQQELAGHLSAAISGGPSPFDSELFSAVPRPPAGSTADVQEDTLLRLSEGLNQIRNVQVEMNGFMSELFKLLQNTVLNESRMKEQQNQQIGMLFLTQAVQDPEKFSKLMPTIQALNELNIATEQLKQADRNPKKRPPE